MFRLLARLLFLALRAALGHDLAVSVIGDLEEERGRRAVRSRVFASLWFLMHVLRVAGYVMARRVQAALTRLTRAGFMDKVILDFTHAFRSLARRPAGTTALVLVLALGVGLTSAMFALVDPFLLRPLPYRDPDRLVVVTLSSGAIRLIAKDTALPTYPQWRDRKDLFVDLAAWSHYAEQAMSVGDRTEELHTQQVSGNFFAVLGQEGSLAPAWPDIARTQEPVLALTDRGHRKIGAPLNASVEDSLGGRHRVAAVLSPDFLFPSAGRTVVLDGLIPYEPGLVLDIRRWNTRGAPSNYEELYFIGRLVPGVSTRQVEAALSWSNAAGEVAKVQVVPLVEMMTERVRPSALGALAAGGLILLVCIGNVANLLIARSAHRTREMATRAALGASRMALARLTAIESLVVATLGTGIGVAVASIALDVMMAITPVEYTALGAPAITGRVWLFAAAAGLTVTTLASVPSWFTRRTGSGAIFGWHGTGDAPKLRPIRFLVTAAQSAVAVVLVIGAALLLRSYINLVGQDPGFDRGTVAVSVRMPPGITGAALQTEVEVSLAKLQRLPTVRDVAASFGKMVDRVGSGSGLTVNGRDAYTDRKEVTLGFFEAAGLSIVEGRALRDEDRDRAGIVVNRAFARTHWPDDSAVGKTVGFGTRQVPIVGVTNDVFDAALDAMPKPTIFLLFYDRVTAAGLTFLIRSDGNAEPLREPVRRALASVNPRIAIREYSTVGSRLSHSVRDRSFATLMLTLFASAALSVSLAGIISVVMFIVTGRTREIAIRMAIGAQRHHVRWLVVREVLWAAAAGAVAGVVAGHGLSGTIESLVYGVDAGSWSTSIVAAAVAVLVMAFAASVPARRAVRLQPTDALRVE
jgi:predicted permease